MLFNLFKKHEKQNVVREVGSNHFASLEVFWFESFMKKVLADYKTMTWIDIGNLENFCERMSWTRSYSETVNLFIVTSDENVWYIVRTSVFSEWLSHGLLLLAEELEQHKRNQLVDKQKYVYDKMQRFSHLYKYITKLRAENISLFNKSSIKFDFVIERYD